MSELSFRSISTIRVCPNCLAIGIVVALILFAQQPLQSQDQKPAPRPISREILSDKQWREVESAVDQGLKFLSQQQRPDGSFQAHPDNDPGISSLCVLAFLSRGHLPEQGPYAECLTRGSEFLLSAQQADGLFSKTRQKYHSHYSHGITSLVVSELYGMSPLQNEARHRRAIEKAIEFTSHRYSQPKAHPEDEGGWRYLQRHRQSDSDLSITSWHVMFLRSAKNSGFEIDAKLIDEALAYMHRLYEPQRKTFRYEIYPDDPPNNYPRGMAGAGVLSLSLSGEHYSEMARNAATYILNRPFDQYERPIAGEEYPCYGAFYCSLGMFHMGGEYWTQFYPKFAATVLHAQRSDGSWIMKQGLDTQFGAPFMTAMTILALTPPYQMLPIFQR